MTEQDPTTPDPVPDEMEDYNHVFSAAETKEMICAALRDKAAIWEEDARVESYRGAASQSMMAMCRWGANQLREIAGVIAHYPNFETRRREKPLTVAIPGFPDMEPFQLYTAPPGLTSTPMPGPMPYRIVPFIGGFTSAPADVAVEAAIKKGEEIRTGSADDSAPVQPKPKPPKDRPPKLPTHE